MDNIFRLMVVEEKGTGDGENIGLGIRMKMTDHDKIWPIISPCESYDLFDGEIRALEDQLKEVREKAKDMFTGSSSQSESDIDPDMSADQAWSILSSISDDKLFVSSFNKLDESKRKEVAEFVLTKCNIFHGRASTFSLRYDSDSGLLDLN